MFPLPNTKVYDQAKEGGVLIGDWGINRSSPWIKLPWISSYEILMKYRKRMLRRYILNPIVIINAARSVLFKIDLKQLKALMRYLVQVFS